MSAAADLVEVPAAASEILLPHRCARDDREAPIPYQLGPRGRERLAAGVSVGAGVALGGSVGAALGASVGAAAAAGAAAGASVGAPGPETAWPALAVGTPGPEAAWPAPAAPDGAAAGDDDIVVREDAP